MKMFNFRAKVKIVGAIFFVVILLAVAVLGGTRIISDSGDNSITFITNSNGGHWEVTNSGLQLAAYDLNSTGGGKVTVPIANISISSTFLLPDNVWVDGQGNESKLILADGVNDDVIRNYDSTNGNVGIKISNLYVDGNADGQTVFAIGKTAIELKRCSGCIIENCYVTNSTCEGIWLRGGNWNTVVNTEIYRSGADNDSGLIVNGAGSSHVCGIWMGGEHASSIINCKSHDNWAHGFAIEQNYGDRIVRDCLIDGCTAWDNEGGIWVEEGINIIVSNNICYNNTRTGIYTQDYGGIIVGGNTKDVLVIGNDCHGNKDRGIVVTGSQNNNISIKCNNIHNHTSHGISVGSVAYNCTISENTICDNDRGIYFSGGKSPRITDNTLLHNSEGIYVTKDVCDQSDAEISRNKIIDVYGAGCYGIRTNIDDSVIKDNIIKRTSGNAIRIDDAVRQVIEGNQIETIITSPRDGILVYSTGSGCHNSTIRFNRISDCTRDGIRLTACVDNVVSDNTFYGNGGENIYDNGCTNLAIFDNTNYNLDTRKTMIWNSNGKYMEATGSNIDAALDDLTTGGSLTLPSGTFSVSGVVSNSVDNITIQGQGNSTIIYLADNSDCNVISVGGDGWTIKNLVINGNGNNQGVGDWYGVYIDGKENTTIEHVGITNVDKSAVKVRPGTNYLDVLFCDINYNNENGLEADGNVNHVKIIRSNFLNNTQAPIYDSMDYNSVDWLVSGCSFLTNGYRVKIQNADFVRVKDCFLENNGGPSGETDGSLSFERCNNSIISECIIKGSFGAGIDIKGCTYVDINDNQVLGNSGGSAAVLTILDDAVLGSALESTHITVSGGIYQDAGASYLVLLQNNAENITFDNVLFRDDTNGIFLSGDCVDINIKNSRFSDFSGDAISELWGGHGTNNSSICRNNFWNCGKGIDFDIADNLVIQNNIFRMCATPIDVNNANVLRPMITGNNWYGCTNNATVAGATGELVTSNVDKDGAWWTTGDNPS